MRYRQVMRILMSARFTQKVLIPGWILILGLVFVIAPPMGVATSLSLFIVGVLVVPAFVLIGSARESPTIS